MLSRKQTAWKKSRKFGDIKGGRMRRRLTDNIFRRFHTLRSPGPTDELPIRLEDNPSGQYIFPLSARECAEAIRGLPGSDQSITHIWLKRPGPKDLKRGMPLAEFICGSGVRLITIYPWRRDLRMCLGRARPTGKQAVAYTRFHGQVFRERGWWYVSFEKSDLRRYFVHVLFHEVGHHVDWYRRRWSKANRRAAEEAADQYAMRYDRHGAEVLAMRADPENAE